MADYVAIVEALRDGLLNEIGWQGDDLSADACRVQADALDALLRDARWRSCPECQCPEFTCIRCGHLMSPDAGAK